MTVEDCPVRAETATGPTIDVIQTAADGNHSLYQLQQLKNGEWKVFGELHMKPYDEQTSLVRLNRPHTQSKSILVRVTGEGWLREAHRRIADMLREDYPRAIVRWWTRGPREDGAR